MARQGARRQARSTDRARFPHVDDVPLCRRGVADGDLVREERPQHHRHASVHASAVGGGRSVVGGEERLGNLQGDRRSSSRDLAEGHLGVEQESCCSRSCTIPRRNRAGARRQGLEARRMRIHSRRHRAQDHRRRARLSEHIQALHRAGSADAQARQWLEGHHLADGRGRRAGRAQPAGHRGRTHQGAAEHRQRHRRRRDDPLLAPETNGAGRGQGVGRDVEADRARRIATSPRRARTRRSATATSRRSRAR